VKVDRLLLVLISVYILGLTTGVLIMSPTKRKVNVIVTRCTPGSLPIEILMHEFIHDEVYKP
jgi:hypothetical protein